MNMMQRAWRGAAMVALLCGAAMAAPLPTPFTYQGELVDGSGVANGTYDLQFRMFNGPNTGAAQVGPTLCSDNVVVVNGRFTVVLDFALAFGEGSNFLEIAVRPDAGADCSSAAGFTTLGPRQALTPTPLAHHASSATKADTATSAGSAAIAGNTSLLSGQAGSFYTDASNLNAGTIPSARLGGSYTGLLSLTNVSNTYFGSGANLTSLNASNVASGILADARLSTNIPRLNTANTFSQPMTINSTLNVNSITIDPTVRTLTLGAYDFDPGNTSASDTSDPYIFNAASARTLAVQIHLPNGAVVTELRLYVRDGSSFEDTTAFLLRRPIDGTAGGTMASVTSSGSDDATIRQFADTTISAAVIDNDVNTYVVRVDMPGTVTSPSMSTKAVRIRYTVTQPLP